MLKISTAVRFEGRVDAVGAGEVVVAVVVEVVVEVVVDNVVDDVVVVDVVVVDVDVVDEDVNVNVDVELKLATGKDILRLKLVLDSLERSGI